MSTEFAIAEVMPGKLNALVKNIMLQTGAKDPNEAVRLINSGEWVITRPTRSWREENGVIYFSVTSDGTTREDWIKRFHLGGSYVEEALLSPDFKSTNGVTTEVAVLIDRLFADKDRTPKKIRAFAEAFRTPDKRKLTKPKAGLACFIREKFTGEEIEAMGLRYIVVMHEPINDSHGCPRLLGTTEPHSPNAPVHHLITYSDGDESRWFHDGGFAFEVSQVGSQS